MYFAARYISLAKPTTTLNFISKLYRRVRGRQEEATRYITSYVTELKRTSLNETEDLSLVEILFCNAIHR
jgi:hypothetical protein